MSDGLPILGRPGVNLAEHDLEHPFLIEELRGPLKIWHQPEPGMRYAFGIDTAGGKKKGDWCVAHGVEVNTRATVAKLKLHMEPVEFGRKCARLGWLYNTAMLAFETWPSAHGATAVEAARAAGYPFLYRRMQEGMVQNQVTNELGWATTTRTKPRMADFVRTALAEGWEINCKSLLSQLLQAKRLDNGEIEFDEHDDEFTAYAIALRVAELMVERGYVSEPTKESGDWTAEWWEHRKRVLEGATPSGGGGSRVWDGV